MKWKIKRYLQKGSIFLDDKRMLLLYSDDTQNLQINK